ncbi:FHIPEP family type III secretion protein [Aquiflexum gelatinilyticum]|uniref:FHIPEP family type III secretion protein n=1 Tax=Aquiflexum gelatinilyticum TaxID=2961943 RepID=A0A9X2T2I9_9BACT|nr:FHIPEP family type III secretion protein [Aquiflexum gelatinilyticum]MCR9016941.1 FHIPEP family type III secretion protein [Aquiflexum gelatinilyticum]
MALKDLFLSSEQLSQIEDMESSLIRRKKTSSVAGYLTIILAVLQVVFLLLEKGQELFAIGLQWKDFLDSFSSPYHVVFLVLFLFSAIYFFLARYTGLLLQESKEPFRYTFWIEGFQYFDSELKVASLCKGADQLSLYLHRDLMEMLNERIRRFSILVKESNSGVSEKLSSRNRKSSHIHVHGSFALREDLEGNLFVQVSPMVRIGPEDAPSTLASPVRFRIAEKGDIDPDLSPSEYKQILERVYSRVSTEIYARIEEDVKEKIKLFPTDFLKAQALYFEADDFAKSNTIDGYEKAIGLFKEALDLYAIIGIPSHWFRRFLRLRWNSIIHHIDFRHAWAMAVIGYCKCRIYRNSLAGQSGRKRNPIFSLPELLEPVIENITELYQRDGKVKERTKLEFLRRSLEFGKQQNRKVSSIFQKHSEVLLEAHLVASMASCFLNSLDKAKAHLEWVEAIGPNRTSINPMYQLVKGLLESDSNMKLIYFQNAIDLDRNFQMSHWFLANQLDFNFRRRGEITLDRSKRVIQAFERVIEINAGNIASLGAAANLLWLAGENEKARKILIEAIDIKAITSQTFIGELNYRLARIAAEEGDFMLCRAKFLEAIATDPSLGSFSLSEYGGSHNSDYDSISSEMLLRYEKFGKTVSSHLKAFKEESDSSDQKLIPENAFKTSEAFVLNDLGNAYLRYFHHFGDQLMLLKAKELYEKAENLSPEIAAVWSNLINVFDWLGEWEKIKLCYENAKLIAPHWKMLAIKSAPYITSAASEKLIKLQKAIDDSEYRTKQAEAEIDKIEKELNEISEKERNPKKRAATVSIDQGSDINRISDLRMERIDLDQSSESKKLEEDKVNLAIKKANLKSEIKTLSEETFKHYQEKEKFEKEAKLIFQEAKETIKKHSRLSSLMVDDDNLLVDYFVNLPSEQLIEDDFLVIESLINVLSGSYLEKSQDNVIALCHRLLAITPQNHNIILSLNAAIVKKIFFRLLDQLETLSNNFSMESKISSEDIKDLMQIWEREKSFGFDSGKFFIMDSTVNFLQNHRQGLQTKIATPEESLPSHNGSGIDLDKKLIAVFMELNKVLGSHSGSNKNISKSVEKLFQDFEINRREILSIVRIWKNTENGSFLSLFWYFYYNENRHESEIQEVVSKYSFKSASVIKNILGNVYLRFYITARGDEFLNKSMLFFNEAIALDDSRPECHVNLSTANFYKLSWKEAVFSLREAIKLDKKNSYKSVLESELAKSINRAGNQYYSNSEFEDAIDNWKNAIELDGSQSSYFHNLSLGLEKRNLNEYPNSINENINALQRAITLDGSLENYRPKLNQFRRRLKLMDSIGNGPLKLVPVVTPILVEYHPDLDMLIMKKSGIELQEEVTQKLKELRNKIENRYGVRIPGVLFRPNIYLHPESTIMISVNEIPLVKNFIYPDRLCGILKEEEIGNYQDKIEAFNPLQNGKSFWIPKSEIQENSAMNFLDPIEYLFLYLEYVFIRNFGDLIILEDISIKCEFNPNQEIKAIVNSPDQLIGLNEVCKALLVERVPILDFNEIAEFFLKQFEKSSLEEIIESLRIKNSIKKRLPGNDLMETASWLGPRFEEVLKENLKFTGKFHYLALEPQLCQNLLLSFRDGVLAQNPKIVIVTDHKIRIHLKKLIELEFPDLLVMSQREIIGDYVAEPSKVIEFKD